MDRSRLYSQHHGLQPAGRNGQLLRGDYASLTLHSATFGGHIEMIEDDQLSALRQAVSDKAVQQRVSLFAEPFDVQADCTAAEPERAARTSVALDQLVAELDLGSLACYYTGTGNPNTAPTLNEEDTMTSVIPGNSLRTARGIPVAGEYKVIQVCGIHARFDEHRDAGGRIQHSSWGKRCVLRVSVFTE